MEVLVHVSAATLTGREEQAGISAETARRLLCDAGIVPVLDGDDAHGTPLDVGRDGDGLRFFDRSGAELPSAGAPTAVRMHLPSVPVPSPPGMATPSTTPPRSAA
ncbi:MAG TPA: hypothetical protein VKE22_17405 [Haliangiales bacterium]|nr:hypothetical protein [Haliangiales bacterium]